MSDDQNMLSGGQDTTGTDGGQQAQAPATEQAQTAAPAAAQQADKSAAEGEQAAKADGAPEQYGDFTLPEGMALDAEVANGFKEFAKGKNLTQADAQSLVDMAAGLVTKAQASYAEAWKAQQMEWVESLQRDPDLGGQKFVESQKAANAALDKFGDPELVEYLKATGLANHPGLFRTFHKIGQLLVEDKFVMGGAPSPKPSDPAARFYPTMKH